MGVGSRASCVGGTAGPLLGPQLDVHAGACPSTGRAARCDWLRLRQP
eukprot:SAG25_NODE_11049_length_315_cov_0.699074_1_plen_46_part_01